jgi:hypothetical protein
LPRLPARPVASLEHGHEAGSPDALLGRAGNFWHIGHAAGGILLPARPKRLFGSGVGRARGDALMFISHAAYMDILYCSKDYMS